jgi:hypothetical protein
MVTCPWEIIFAGRRSGILRYLGDRASPGAMAGGLDLAFVAGLINKLDGDSLVSSKIRTPADLKVRVWSSKHRRKGGKYFIGLSVTTLFFVAMLNMH